ncbi:MAG: DUF5658 family protein [Candidatus Bathyarchaeota archaeon]|nr:DUF5658 family protein [Candidatus Bathyarchaeota archaeon]
MFKTSVFPALLLVLAGSMDCLTTGIGISYFGAVECNPFMAGLVHTNLAAFTLLKLATTLVVVLIFYSARKILASTYDKASKAFKIGHNFIKTAYAGVIAITLVVVANNVLVIAGSV